MWLRAQIGSFRMGARGCTVLYGSYPRYFCNCHLLSYCESTLGCAFIEDPPNEMLVMNEEPKENHFAYSICRFCESACNLLAGGVVVEKDSRTIFAAGSGLTLAFAEPFFNSTDIYR